MNAGYVIGIFGGEPYVQVSSTVFATLDEARDALPEVQARFACRLGVARMLSAAECDEHQRYIAVWRRAGGLEIDTELQASVIAGSTGSDTNKEKNASLS